MFKRTQARLCVALVIPLLLATQNLQAEEVHPDAPDSLPGATKVDAEGVISTLGEVENLIVIDARVAMDRKQGYIEGSISLPDTDTDCETLSVIVPTLNNPVLFYCNGPKCGRSVKSIYKAQECGYTTLYWFRGGFEEWTKKNYPILKE